MCPRKTSSVRACVRGCAHPFPGPRMYILTCFPSNGNEPTQNLAPSLGSKSVIKDPRRSEDHSDQGEAHLQPHTRGAPAGAEESSVPRLGLLWGPNYTGST